jgi:hypothetical protein
MVVGQGGVGRTGKGGGGDEWLCAGRYAVSWVFLHHFVKRTITLEDEFLLYVVLIEGEESRGSRAWVHSPE